MNCLIDYTLIDTMNLLPKIKFLQVRIWVMLLNDPNGTTVLKEYLT